MVCFFAALLAVVAVTLQGAAAVPYPFTNGTVPVTGPTGTASSGLPSPTGFQRGLRELRVGLPRP